LTAIFAGLAKNRKLWSKLRVRMLTHPKLTMLVWRMLMHLSLGHKALLPGEF